MTDQTNQFPPLTHEEVLEHIEKMAEPNPNTGHFPTWDEFDALYNPFKDFYATQNCSSPHCSSPSIKPLLDSIDRAIATMKEQGDPPIALATAILANLLEHQLKQLGLSSLADMLRQ